MEMSSTKDPTKNAEGYKDTTPYYSMRHIKAVETKAYHVVQTMAHVAKCGGFEVMPGLKMRDRDGRIHDADKLIRAKSVQSLQSLSEDTQQ